MAKKEKPDLAAQYIDSTWEEILADLNKDFGEGTIVKASVARGARIEFISTGSAALDIALGGGFPKNRITEIRGPFSSFKSTISNLGIIQFLKSHPKGYAVIVDLEKSFDPVYAEALGMDLDRVYIVNPDNGEQSVDILNRLLCANVDIFAVIDSIAAMTPSNEVETSVDQHTMALHARLVGRCMKILNNRIKRHLYKRNRPSTTVICLNQLREKVGVMFGNPETTPGGKAKDFYYSMMIRMQSSASESISKEETRNKIKRTVRYGQLVSFKVLKNKCGGPQYEEGDFTFYTRPFKGYGTFEIDNDSALFNLGAFNDVIPYKEGRGFVYNGISKRRETDMQRVIKEADDGFREDLKLDILRKVAPNLYPLSSVEKKSAGKLKLLKKRPVDDDDED